MYNHQQIKLIPNNRIREWLTMNENEKIAWLVNELPPPGEDDWASLDDILGIGTMGEQARRLARGLPYPGDHVVSEPLWKILTGQRPMPLVGEPAVALVKRYLTILETELS